MINTVRIIFSNIFCLVFFLIYGWQWRRKIKVKPREKRKLLEIQKKINLSLQSRNTDDDNKSRTGGWLQIFFQSLISGVFSFEGPKQNEGKIN